MTSVFCFVLFLGAYQFSYSFPPPHPPPQLSHIFLWAVIFRVSRLNFFGDNLSWLFKCSGLDCFPPPPPPQFLNSSIATNWIWFCCCCCCLSFYSTGKKYFWELSNRLIAAAVVVVVVIDVCAMSLVFFFHFYLALFYLFSAVLGACACVCSVCEQQFSLFKLIKKCHLCCCVCVCVQEGEKSEGDRHFN